MRANESAESWSSNDSITAYDDWPAENADDESAGSDSRCSAAFALPFSLSFAALSSSAPVRIALGAACTMRISVTLFMIAAANWQKSATESSMGTARTHTIGDLPSGSDVAGALVVVADGDADASDVRMASR